MNTTARLTQFEIFRLLLMFFIVVWHSIVHGMDMSCNRFPLFDSSDPANALNFVSTSALTSITAVAVNCYVIMTGYFMIKAQAIKWEKIIMLWIQVFFYSSMIAILFYLTSRISFRELRHALLPVFYDQYWFMSKYLVLAAFAPFLAKFPASRHTRSACTFSMTTYMYGITSGMTCYP